MWGWVVLARAFKSAGTCEAEAGESMSWRPAWPSSRTARAKQKNPVLEKQNQTNQPNRNLWTGGKKNDGQHFIFLYYI